MKKLIFIGIVAALASCNSNPGTDAKTDSKGDSATVATADVSYPYPIIYSSKFTTGDSKHIQAVLDIWKAWDNGNLSAVKDHFADSVEMYFWDGSSLHASRDSVIAATQKVRNNFSAVSSSVDAVTALKS